MKASSGGGARGRPAESRTGSRDGKEVAVYVCDGAIGSEVRDIAPVSVFLACLSVTT